MSGQRDSCLSSPNLPRGKREGGKRFIALYAVSVTVVIGTAAVLKLVETYICFHPIITEVLACPLRFTGRAPLDIAAMYFAPMVAVLLGSLLLAGPLISTSYLVAAWIGANVVEHVTSTAEMSGGSAPLFGASTIADPFWAQYIVPVVCSVLLGWVLQRRMEHNQRPVAS